MESFKTWDYPARVRGPKNLILTLFGIVNREVPYNLMITKLVILFAGMAWPVAGQVIDIASARTRVDSNYVPTNTTELLTVEGIVTTHTNLTTAANTHFYIQDDTAGIAVFVTGLPSSPPPAGTRVRVTGPLGLLNGLLEFNMSSANASHTIVTLGGNNPLPEPLFFPDFARTGDTPYMKSVVEGALVVVSNVFVDQTGGANFPAGGGTVNITNESGQILTLRIDARVELRGQAKPPGPVTIIGVMSIFDNSPPHTSSFQLLPSRAADVIGFVRAPVVSFTNRLEDLVRPGDAPVNSFTEQTLRPGERVTVNLSARDPDGGSITVTPVDTENPPGVTWTLSDNPGTNVFATVTYTASAPHAGQRFQLWLEVAKTNATNIFRETIYVPTSVEQQIIISEFLVNPADTNSPLSNPLNRPDPSTNPSAHDEFIEIVNLGAAEVDLAGWMISDDTGPRHTFFDLFPVSSSNAVIVYGGPLTGNFPNLPVPSAPLNPGAGNTSVFNNGGDSIVLRNAASNLVARVVYTAAAPVGGVSLTRWPTMANDFTPHTNVINAHVSPGRQYDGSPYDVPPGPTNAPPTISDIADLTTPFNTSTGPIPFTVGDAETAAGALTLAGSSTDQALVPDANIVFGGSGPNRTVTITPVDFESGKTLITITVTDEHGRSRSDSFVLTVQDSDNPPTILNIPNQQTSPGTATPAIPFVVFDSETDAGSLLVFGTSGNQALVPDANIVFGGSGSNRTVTITPAGAVTGTATITIFVTDGSFTSSNSFILSVLPAILLGDDFSYPDGSIITNSAFFWNTHSATAGQTGQTQVINGELRISSSQSEDINAPLTNAPYAAASGMILYAGFTVNFTQLPNAAGTYFAHFKDGANGFRARIYSGTANAASGAFRLGIANGAGTVSQAGFDLQLSNTHAVVVRYNLGTGESTLWVNPTGESSPGVTALDAPSTITVVSWAFRQAAGIGTMAIDELKVGTSFAAVSPYVRQPASLRIDRIGGGMQISWPVSAPGNLQGTPSLTQINWQTVAEPVSTNGNHKLVTIVNPTGSRFFRLAE